MLVVLGEDIFFPFLFFLSNSVLTAFLVHPPCLVTKAIIALSILSSPIAFLLSNSRVGIVGYYVYLTFKYYANFTYVVYKLITKRVLPLTCKRCGYKVGNYFLTFQLSF